MQAINSASQTMHFNPNRVVLISGRLPTDPNEVFYLHGISPPPIPQLSGSMDEFVKTMPNGSGFAKLTFAQTGEPFYLNTQMVRAINPLLPEVQLVRPNAHAVISIGGHNRFVRETVDEAKAIINQAGGSL